MTAKQTIATGRMQYVCCCVDLGHGRQGVADLNAMIESGHDISYSHFRRLVGPALDEWALSMGYALRGNQELTLRRDWHVGYYRSTWRGQPCCYLKHSGIEYIFV